MRRASPRPSSVQRKRFSPALTAAHSISKVRLSLSLFFWLEINRVKRISTFSSSPSHLSVECLRGIKRRDYHQVRRRLYTHHTHDGVIGQGLIKASVTPALRAPQWRICQCVNHGKGDWIIYCCCSFQNPPLLCLVWRTFHLILYRLFCRMVKVIADEFLTDERERKYYADRYSCCPPPLFIIFITLVEVGTSGLISTPSLSFVRRNPHRTLELHPSSLITGWHV